MFRTSGFIFLSGRLTALVLLLAFQICLVRILAPAEYGAFALVFALGTLMQTAVAFGIPRLIPKYISQAGITLSHAVVRLLAIRLLALRIVGTTLLTLVTIGAAWWLGLLQTTDPRLIVFGALYILAGVVLLDVDSMAQSLSLQRVSRNGTVGEAALRLVLVFGLALAGHIHSAADVVLISVCTTALLSVFLLRSVFRLLSSPDELTDETPLDIAELRAMGLSGYASSMAWFASSPAVIRLIAGHMLTVIPFAGFSFAQGLVASFQRYTPGMLLFPFIEPAVMKYFARTGDRSRLEHALSLMAKIDMIVIGASIVGTIVAGQALVEVMTGGRYGAFAYALPWLLVYIVTSSVYRAFETVAVALSAASALTRTLALSLVWLGIAIALTGRFGLIALLICPVGDALSRLTLMHFALRKLGIRHVIDVRTTVCIIALIGLCGFLGTETVQYFTLDRLASIGVGTIAATVFLLALALSKPLRTGEVEIITGLGQGPMQAFLRRHARA